MTYQHDIGKGLNKIGINNIINCRTLHSHSECTRLYDAGSAVGTVLICEMRFIGWIWTSSCDVLACCHLERYLLVLQRGVRQQTSPKQLHLQLHLQLLHQTCLQHLLEMTQQLPLQLLLQLGQGLVALYSCPFSCQPCGKQTFRHSRG